MKSLTRRQFLKGAGAVSLATILGACKVFPDVQETIEEPATDPKDYLHVSIYYDDSVDLSDQGLSSCERTVHIHTVVPDSFELDNGRVKTNEIWAAVVSPNERELFYRDREQIPDMVYFGDSLDNTNIVYKGAKHNLRVDSIQDYFYHNFIEVGVEGDQEELKARFLIKDGEIHSLGHYAGSEEPQEVEWFEVDKDTAHLIGLSDEDVTMNCGIVVRKPKLFGAVDQVVLKIPALEQLCHLFVVDDASPASDALISTDLAAYLVQKNRLTQDNYKQALNSEVARSDLANRFTSVVYNGQARLIVGDTSPASHTIIAVDSAVFLRDKYGIEAPVLLDSEVEHYDDLTKLF